MYLPPFVITTRQFGSFPAIEIVFLLYLYLTWVFFFIKKNICNSVSSRVFLLDRPFCVFKIKKQRIQFAVLGKTDIEYHCYHRQATSHSIQGNQTAILRSIANYIHCGNDCYESVDTRTHNS